jgi:hypothetical protein
MRQGHILIILLLTSSFLFSQKSDKVTADNSLKTFDPRLKYFYIGFTIGICNDATEFAEYGPNIYKAKCQSTSFGLTVRKHFNKSLSLETGVFFKPYTVGFGAKLPTFSIENNSSSALTIQVPLRLHSKVNIYKNKIFLGGTIGYVYAFNLNHGQGDTSGIYTPIYSNSSKSSSDSIFYSTRTKTTNDKQLSLIQTGISIEFKLYKNISLEISYNYYTGFKHFQDTKITYIINDSPIYFTKMFMTGSYSCFGLSLQSAIHNRTKKQKNN